MDLEWLNQQFVQLDRPGLAFEIRVRDVATNELWIVIKRINDRSRDHDLVGHSDTDETRCKVDRVSKKVVVLDHYRAEVERRSEMHFFAGGSAGILLLDGLHDFLTSECRLFDIDEIRHDGVADGLDERPAMILDDWRHQIFVTHH